jgi:phage shock protein B
MFGINLVEILLILSITLGLPILLLVCVSKGLRSGSSRAGLQSNPEEARMIQQIYEDLQRMERRVEALETILLDRARDQERV